MCIDHDHPYEYSLDQPLVQSLQQPLVQSFLHSLDQSFVYTHDSRDVGRFGDFIRGYNDVCTFKHLCALEHFCISNDHHSSNNCSIPDGR